MAAVLEQNEIDLLSIQHHLKTDVDKAISDLLEIRDPGLLGSEGIYNALKQGHRRINRLCGELITCIRARAANLQLAACVGLSDSLKTSRLNGIRQALDALREDGELVKKANQILRQRVQSFDGLTNKTLTVTKRKLELLNLGESFAKEIKAKREDIERRVDSANHLFLEQEQPVRLLLKLDGDQVVGLKVM